MVTESEILLRVQHFQQRRSRIASKITAHLVDFVKQKDRIHGPCALHSFDNTPRDGTHIGAPMSADFRLVTHAAQRHLHKLSANRFGNRAHHTGFTDARRADKAQDRPFHILFDTQNGKILDDSFLHFLQTVMIPIQNTARMFQIQMIFCHFSPRQIENPFHIGLAHRNFRCARRHTGNTVQLALRFLAGFVVQRRGCQLFAHFLYVVLFLVAQFRLDRLNLFAQVIILLVFLNLLFYTRLYVLFQFGQPCFPRKNPAKGFQPFLHIQFLQNRLPILQLDQHVRGDRIGQQIGFFYRRY